MATKPLRSDSGVQMATGTASWQGSTGVGGVYYKTGVGLVMRKTDNTEVTLGAGGGSTGNWVFASNDADLSGAGTLTIAAGGVATGVTIGSTGLGTMQLTGARFLIAQRALTTGNQQSALAITGGVHTALTASTEQFDVNYSLARNVQFATGALTTQRAFIVQAPTYAFVGASVLTNAATVAITGPPIAGTNATLTNTYALWVQSGNIGIGANGSILNSAQAATNTTALTFTSNVADGATSVATRFDNGTALTTDGALAYQFRNNGADRFTIGRTSSAWKFTFFGDADASGNGPVLIKSTASSAGLTLDASTAGGRIYQQYSTSAGLYVVADITAATNRWQMDSSGHWSPFADNSYDLGIATTNRVRTLNAVRSDALRITSPTQNLAFSATPAINATNGGVIHIGPITANVTGPTMTGGAAGERCSIVWLKDGTAGTFTIAGWGANVRVNGTATFAAGANAIIVQSFVWDDRLGTPAWVLQSQQAVV